MKVQIIHDRDPDGWCQHIVFIDGRRIARDHLEIENIDPGAGHEPEEFTARREAASKRADSGSSTEFDRILAGMLADAPFEKWSLNDDD